MNSYILLRNKIESKPMSLEELQATGLRAGDLIWVECQSWDWQRPEEIPELKMLLEGKTPPVIALKSPVSTKEPIKPAGNLSSKGEIKPKTKLKVAQTIFPDEQAFNIPEKKETPAVVPDIETNMEVHAQSEPIVPITEAPLKVTVPDIDADMYKYGGISAATSSIKEDPVVAKQDDQPLPKEEVNKTNKVKQDEEVTINTKYSRSLDEIKEMYVKNLAEQGRLGKTRKVIGLPGNIKKIAVYVGFAAVGAIVMLLLRNTGSTKNITSVPQIQSQATKPADQVAGAEEPVILTEQPDPSIAVVNNDPAPATAGQGREMVINDPPARDEKIFSEPVSPAAAERKPATREEKLKEDDNESKQPATEKPREKIKITSDLSSMVSVKANDYVTGSFGGIRNLEMTVQNDSKWLLDEVTVELKYLNLDNIIVNTDRITFRSVQPGEPETIAVKKSRRGLKVKYRIVKIESREASNSTASF
jgi:hypothetical protein